MVIVEIEHLAGASAALHSISRFPFQNIHFSSIFIFVFFFSKLFYSRPLCVFVCSVLIMCQTSWISSRPRVCMSVLKWKERKIEYGKLTMSKIKTMLGLHFLFFFFFGGYFIKQWQTWYHQQPTTMWWSENWIIV